MARSIWLRNYLVISMVSIALSAVSASAETIAPGVSFTGGAINQVTIEANGKRMAVYAPLVVDGGNQPLAADYLLLTHHRRDAIWSGLSQIDPSTRIIAPAAERGLLEEPEKFWNRFPTSRFHDYSCTTTKILTQPVIASRYVSDGDTIQWQSMNIQVVATPGYTPGAVSNVLNRDGRRLAFTGDLIYGDGQILDLFSFQDAIAAAEIRGYHGYGSRLAELVNSLQAIDALQADVLVPARGPLITDPHAAIKRLIQRVRALYRSYLSTSALHWYFKEERMRKCGQRILGDGAEVELMPYSLHQKAPDWVFENATSRVIISDSGNGWLIDCGYQRVIDSVQKLIDDGLIKRVEGIFVTHYHDDHTDMVSAAAERFNCPVYADSELVDILQNPAAYRMPAMTSNKILEVRSMESGQTMQWHEFQFTFHHFPGQALYHGALYVQRAKERPIFFVGDSFAPSGIDDYCVLNRNLVGGGQGYNLCIEKLRQIKEPFWLVNEHIPFVFQFTATELDKLDEQIQKRIKVMRELFPWDSPNYALDEQWATFYPYGQKVTPRASVPIEFRIQNHSPVERRFEVQIHCPKGLTCETSSGSVQIPPLKTGTIKLSLVADETAGTHVITADVKSEGMHLRHWSEALVTVEP